MKWDDSLKIGCRLIDSQHQELVRHVDALERLVDSEIAGQQLLETLRFVVDYARKHFEAEEKLMASIAYPGLDEQKKLHNDLINYITGFLLDLQAGHQCSSSELVDFLVAWVSGHVLGEDRKIGDFMRQHNLECDL